MKRWIVSVCVVVIVVAAGWYWGHDILVRQVFAPTEQTAQSGVVVPDVVPTASLTESKEDVEVVVENLEIPWEIAWLPSGDMLVTERPGRLLKVGADRSVIEVTGVAHVGEGGLQGMAVHPQFAKNQWIYLYLTSRSSGSLVNRVERYRLEGANLKDKTTIIDSIPGGQVHDGGRIAFGPDGFLYVATGDAGEPRLAPDIQSRAGKILRIGDDGSIPADNSFPNGVYSYGHRNPQGLTWDNQGQLWATEHGRSGVQSGFDELNLIVKGSNYGWPDSEGDTVRAGTKGPVLHSGATTTWAPAGAAVLGNRLYFTGLRGEALYSVDLSNGTARNLTRHLGGSFGRLRAVQVGPDGKIYISTSNRDGRGEITTGDDKIIRLSSELLL